MPFHIFVFGDDLPSFQVSFTFIISAGHFGRGVMTFENSNILRVAGNGNIIR